MDIDEDRIEAVDRFCVAKNAMAAQIARTYVLV
jgi:hypothetical protein